MLFVEIRAYDKLANVSGFCVLNRNCIRAYKIFGPIGVSRGVIFLQFCPHFSGKKYGYCSASFVFKKISKNNF